MNLRDFARDKPCLVRLPCCNGNPETSVLAHYRMAGYSGGSQKPPDIMGAIACSACHDAIDQRAELEGYDRAALRLAHAEGVMRTFVLALEAGVIRIGGKAK